METSEQITTKNLEITEEFVRCVAPNADGILLSGSNAWGANYAVTSTSDIDLLVTGTVGQLEKVTVGLVLPELLEEKENERFKVFRNLYTKKRAEQFSTISTYREAKLSIDLLPIEVVEDMCTIASMGAKRIDDVVIRTVKEFRINPPQMVGYSVDDLNGLKKLVYHPDFEEIKNKSNVTVGYLADTLVDAQTNSTYFLGVMSFFFAIHPVILFDKTGKLQNAVETLHAGIVRIMRGQMPTYITRQERMSEEVLKEVKSTLSSVQDKSGIKIQP